MNFDAANGTRILILQPALTAALIQEQPVGVRPDRIRKPAKPPPNRPRHAAHRQISESDTQSRIGAPRPRALKRARGDDDRPSKMPSPGLMMFTPSFRAFSVASNH
jgi:hypothetical protein